MNTTTTPDSSASASLAEDNDDGDDDNSPDTAASRRHGVLFMGLSLLMFTGNVLLLKYLGGSLHIDAWVSVAFRAVVGILVLLPLLASGEALRFAPLVTDGRMVIRGILGIVGTMAFYWIIPVLGAGMSTLISTTYVMFAAVLALFWLKEALTLFRALAMLLAMLGVALLTGLAGGTDASFGWPHVIAFAGVLSSAAVVVLIRQLTKSYSIATIFLCQCLYMVVIALPMAILRFEWPGIIAIALLTGAGACAAAGQLSMNAGFKRLTVGAGTSVQMALPVLAAGGGMLFFGETYTAIQIAGAVLVLAGCYFSSRPQKVRHAVSSRSLASNRTPAVEETPDPVPISYK